MNTYYTFDIGKTENEPLVYSVYEHLSKLNENILNISQIVSTNVPSLYHTATSVVVFFII